MAALLIDTDHVMRLAGLVDQAGLAVTGATVTASMLDKKFDPVTVSPWPLTLGDDGGGDYSVLIPDDEALQLGLVYNMRIDIDKGGVKRTYFEPVSVMRGTF